MPERSARDDQELQVGLFADRPPVEWLAGVAVEHLDAAVRPIADVNTPADRVSGDAVHGVEVAGTGFTSARHAEHARGPEELAVLVELGDAVAVVAVGDEHAAVGQEGKERGTVEVRRIGSGLVRRTERHHDLLAVVRHLEDGVLVIVDDPHVLLRIPRVDVDSVRPPHHLVPLRPRFDDVAGGIEDDDGVLPARIDAHAPAPLLLRIVGVGARAAGAGRARGRTLGGVAPRYLSHRERQAGADLRHRPCRGTHHQRQLAALHHVDAVGTLGEHSLCRAPRPVFVAGKAGRHRFRPVGHHFVRTGNVEAAFFARHRRKPGIGRCLALYGRLVARHQPSRQKCQREAGHYHCFCTHRCSSRNGPDHYWPVSSKLLQAAPLSRPANRASRPVVTTLRLSGRSIEGLQSSPRPAQRQTLD